MSRVIYETVYLPWKDNNEGKPWLYSGSDYYNNPVYLGSASSSAVYEWTEGHTVKQWWAKEVNEHPERFQKTILLEVGNHTTRNELQKLESVIQTVEDHRNDCRYFNRTNKHFNTGTPKNVLKGMSYEEIYSEEKCKSLKKQKSEHFKKLRSELDQSGKNNPMYGRSAAIEQRLRWYTNGKETIFVTEGTEPKGFVRGRKIK